MKWSEAQNNKLGVVFADVEDIRDFRQSFNAAMDRLEEKYKDVPLCTPDNPIIKPIFIVLNIDKFVPPKEWLDN